MLFTPRTQYGCATDAPGSHCALECFVRSALGTRPISPFRPAGLSTGEVGRSSRVVSALTWPLSVDRRPPFRSGST